MSHGNNGQQGRNFGYVGYKHGRMARSSLWTMEQDAHRLRDLLRDEDELPPWVTYKIDTAADRLSAATKYINYRVAQTEGRANPRSRRNTGSGFWKLSATETLGVVTVGLGLGWVANKVSNAQTSPSSHQTAMLLGGAALYTLGVVIGTNRPAGGWLGSGEEG